MSAATQASAADTPIYTRGIGVYPGDPREDFAPELVAADPSAYRNLALHRPAYQSSSYDYNLTAQLITDGIKDTRLPNWVVTSEAARGILQKHERELLLDHNLVAGVETVGPQGWVQVQFCGGGDRPEVDKVRVLAVARGRIDKAHVGFTVSVSNDGREWKKAGTISGIDPAPLDGFPNGFAHSGQLFIASVPLSEVSRSSHYRIHFAGNEGPWLVGEVSFFKGDTAVEAGGPYHFTSAWMSEGLGEEWVSVDLGTSCEFDRVVLSWIARAAEGVIQVSDDAVSWRDIQALSVSDDIKLLQPARGRYVRVLMRRPTSPHGYILSELEVYGRGGLVAKPKAENGWRLQRDSLVKDDGAALSKRGYRDDDWVLATVPGTVLSSYLNVGALPDPNYGDNQLLISDSFFYADFWYRMEFESAAIKDGEIAWLHFDGINWKAQVFLNGEQLGQIDGGFTRARFDVTKRLSSTQKNALAVRVIKNATPGSAKQKTYRSPGMNGGALGLDNPTYHASIGWDWIPTIRGRNTGIWGPVHFSRTGAVTLENQFVTTTLPLPDLSRAEVSIQVDAVNHRSSAMTGTLRGRFGDRPFEKRVTIPASAMQTVKCELSVPDPKLWWPAGYGEPHLYAVELSFENSDKKSFHAGLRQMTYTEDGGALKIYINGRRLIPKGGNWGFSESMLRYRAREFDAAVRYHRDMNFTIIRNWVAQTGQDEFFEACDRHGIMVWQDFWLANPWDGPEPANDDMFMQNARDYILRIRHHASVGLYCGRNEGMPPAALESGLRKVLSELHADIHYIPDSAHGVVSGEGPYRAMPLEFYFTGGAAEKFHSEMGMPNIPTMDSVRAMMPDASLWPQGLTWGLHDFCLEGAQGGESFLRTIEAGYGGARNVEEWVRLAQFLNYEGYRAMFEGQSKYRMGLLLWMSHPCWPSFVWQTYDYFLDPSAAYFGCKKACEPLHIQWNRATESIEVVNHSGGNVRGLSASVEVFNMDGARMLEKAISLDSKEDSVVACFDMKYPPGLSAVHFIQLRLAQANKTVSSNFYLRANEPENLRAIRQLPKAQLGSKTSTERQGKRWILRTELNNISNAPALMVCLKAVREKSGDRILPVLYSDNYFSLFPGGRESIVTELQDADTRGEAPRIVVEGFNV